jgi:hypothetical protein
MTKLRTMKTPSRPDTGTTKAVPVSLHPLSTEQALAALLRTPQHPTKQVEPTKPSQRKGRGNAQDRKD